MLTMPGVIPVTMPEDEPTVAMAGLLLTQVPPAVASVSVVVAPWHWWVMPVIADTVGNECTVSACVVKAVPQALVTV